MPSESENSKPQVFPEATLKTSKKRLPHQFQPGNPGGPGHPKGVKNHASLVKEAALQLEHNLIMSWNKGNGPKWFKSFVKQNPKEALELILPIIIRSANSKNKDEGDVNNNLSLLQIFGNTRAREAEEIAAGKDQMEVLFGKEFVEKVRGESFLGNGGK